MSQRDIAKEILEYLRWNPNSRPSDIANALGISPNLVRAILTRLRRKGLVVKTSRGYSVRLVEVEESERASDSSTELEVEVREAEAVDRDRGLETITSPETFPSQNIQRTAVEPPRSTAITSPMAMSGAGDVEKIDKLAEDLENIKNRIKSLEETLTMLIFSVSKAIEILQIVLLALRERDIYAIDRALDQLETIVSELRELSCRGKE